MRLDILLVQKGFFASREKAKYAIEKQAVTINGKAAQKASMEIADHDVVEVVSVALRYVSLGGLKLEKAIQDFNLDFENKIILDVGASTGGFTDCALQHGAKKVFAIDVGSEQLHDSLRFKLEVISIENQNLKHLTIHQLENNLVDVIVMDVSFTSQIPLIPYLKQFIIEGGLIVSLIKPQFEMEHHRRFRGGIIKDEKIHQQCIRRVCEAAFEHGFSLVGISDAPLQEGKNKEFLGVFKKK
jgi:23S rRNA (cytidine1920-2'-O)/16S rRNA (cytidine1409-2'-O)-methyltransferase